MALNFDNLTAICKSKYIPILEDNIFNSSWLLKQMRARPDVLDGGKDIHVPLQYAKGRGGAYAEWDLLNVAPKEIRTAAVFDWKYYYANMTVSKQQEDQITGEAAVLNLLQIESESAQKTLTDEIGTALFNDGSDSQEAHGLRKIIGYDRTLGGIDSSTYDWFDANVAVDVNANYSTTNLTAANLTNPSSDYFILTVMRNVWMPCIHNAEHPNMIVVSDGVYNLLEQVLQPYMTYNYSAGAKSAADAGFQVIEYKGVPVVYDEYCTSAFMFMVNTKYCGLKILSGDNFQMSPWKVPVNQMAKMAQVSVTLNFVSSNPRHLGKIEFASAVG